MTHSSLGRLDLLNWQQKKSTSSVTCWSCLPALHYQLLLLCFDLINKSPFLKQQTHHPPNIYQFLPCGDLNSPETVEMKIVRSKITVSDLSDMLKLCEADLEENRGDPNMSDNL